MKSRFARTLATTAAAALLTVSTGAAAAPNRAAPLALAKSPAARAGTATANKSRLGADVAGSTLINIGILAALSVLVLTVVASDGADSPDSP